MTRDPATSRRSPHICGPHDFAAAFHVSRETIARLELYETLLRQWQRAVNLVAPGTVDDIWHRHFADSAQLVPLAPGARTWVDLGSGGGFPGMVVAIMLAETARPQSSPSPSTLQGEGTGAPRLTLVESNARKCAFLGEVARQTGIAPGIAVDILSTRIEVAATQASLQGSNVVSARAVAPLDKLLGLAAPLFSAGTIGLFLKGRDAAAELTAAEGRWDFEADLIPSRTDPEARVVIIRHLRARNNAKTKE